MLETFEKLPREKQEKILDSAAEIFALRGYHAASIKELCDQAKISNGALYKYFNNKEDLFFSVLDRCHKIIAEELFIQRTLTTKSIFDSIYEYLRGIQVLVEKYPYYITVYAELASNQMESFAYEATQKIEFESRTYIQHIVEQAKKSGEINISLDEHLLAFLIDNYFVLYLYSLVSEFHNNRFKSFLLKNDLETLTDDQKIEFIMLSLRTILKKS